MEIEKAKPTLAANRKAVAKYAASKRGKATIRAKIAVQNAKRSGKLKTAKSCSKCGRSGVRLSFHHTDTSYKEGNELKGTYLCDKCHRNRPEHRKRHSQAIKKINR